VIAEIDLLITLCFLFSKGKLQQLKNWQLQMFVEEQDHQLQQRFVFVKD
jgi:hypothetical protein